MRLNKYLTCFLQVYHILQSIVSIGRGTTFKQKPNVTSQSLFFVHDKLQEKLSFIKFIRTLFTLNLLLSEENKSYR